jgi:hypothetical protein
MQALKLALCAALSFNIVVAAGGAEASTLIGSTATVSVTGQAGIVGPSTALIGAGSEFTIDPQSFGTWSVDIGLDAVSYVYNSPNNLATNFNANRSITLTGLDFISPAAIISGINVVSNNVSGVSAANFTFGPNSLTILLGLQVATSTWAPNGSVVVTLQTTPVAVSEPGSLTLMMTALLGLAAMRRRRAVQG